MKAFINVLLTLILLGGIGLLLFPTISDQYSKYQNTLVMSAYVRAAEELPTEETLAMLERCAAYNEQGGGSQIDDAFSATAKAEPSEEYMALLNPNDDGVMGIIEIPKIGVTLPIYHTTQSDVLENGVGHVEGTSLPVGGSAIHCVLAGHRGLPTARLFTDLDQIVEGDLFYIKVLNQNLAYRVDQILVVEPDDTEDMRLFEGKEYVTLVTCTPYGINSQRLLIRGERIEMENFVEVLSVDGAEPMPLWKSALMLALPLFIPLWIIFMILERLLRKR